MTEVKEEVVPVLMQEVDPDTKKAIINKLLEDADKEEAHVDIVSQLKQKATDDDGEEEKEEENVIPVDKKKKKKVQFEKIVFPLVKMLESQVTYEEVSPIMKSFVTRVKEALNRSGMVSVFLNKEEEGFDFDAYGDVIGFIFGMIDDLIAEYGPSKVKNRKVGPSPPELLHKMLTLVMDENSLWPQDEDEEDEDDDDEGEDYDDDDDDDDDDDEKAWERYYGAAAPKKMKK